jgi:hypothetical protein
VVDPFDAHSRDRGTRHRRQQHPAQGITEGQTKPALQWVNLEFGVILGLLKDFYLGIKLFEQFRRTSPEVLWREAI